MKLFITRTSPYSRKIRILIRVLGIQDQVEEIVVNTTEPSAEFLEHNPLGKVPTLVVEEQALCDSHLIMNYLQERFGTEEPYDWAQKNSLWLAQGLIDCAYQWVMQQRVTDTSPSAKALSKLQIKIERLLIHLDQHVPDTEPDDNFAITLACALAYLDFRKVRIDWRELAPHLNAWLELWSNFEAFSDTAPGDS